MERNLIEKRKREEGRYALRLKKCKTCSKLERYKWSKKGREFN